MDANGNFTCSECKYVSPHWSGPVLGNWSCTKEDGKYYMKPCVFKVPCEHFVFANAHILSSEEGMKKLGGEA